MRVIAGTARGRRLAAPKGQGTRPTPDRVREALFSLLAANLPEARVLDLFAGTGALGIEALSRGASHATFVEKDRAALEVLRRNLEVVADTDHEVIPRSLPRALAELPGDPPFDLVFMDPPYRSGLLAPTLMGLAERRLLAREGIAVCEHSGSGDRQATAEAAPDPPADWTRLETRSWGDVAITLLSPLEHPQQ